MKLYDFFLIFGIFLICFFSASSFLKAFNINNAAPSEVSSAWADVVEKMNQTTRSIEENRAKIESGNPLEVVSGTFGIAFSGIFYLIFVVFGSLIAIPATFYSAINYIAFVFHIPSEIVVTIIAVIGVYISIKMFEFITGRSLT